MKRSIPEEIITNKYNHLLVSLILLFILSPSLEVRDQANFPIIPLIALAVFVNAVRVSFPQRTFFWAFLLFAMVSFVLNLTIFFVVNSYPDFAKVLRFISNIISVMYYSVVVFMLTKQLFSVRRVTADTIKGGVSAYIMLGFLWAILYGLLTQIDPNAFVVSSETGMMFLHFSFTTLTTLGYGDIVPNGRYAAILTNSEAIVGQLYLVIFVARLVGLYIATESTKENNH